MDTGSAAALWMAVVALGAYHGLNPAMGWPLAVANGLGERRAGAVFATLMPLGAGHLLAMALVLVPFSVLTTVAQWQQPIRIAGALLVLGFGLYRLVQRRHPRWLARIRPTQLVLWSFVIATAHGAGIMLLPFALGLCGAAPGVSRLLAAGLGTALAVSLVHTASMMGVGMACAWTVYRYLGLRHLNRGWFDLDTAWAASLVLAGGASLLLVMPAVAATTEPVRPPTGHPLIGKWQWTRGSNKCTEVYEFRPDGTAPVVSGDERTDNLYTISPDPDVNGFYRLTMHITKDHGGKDCADDASDSTGVESTNFLQFSPDGSEYIACLEPKVERCFGPLRKQRQ